MKKILSLTLVLVLVLGSFPMAFADNHMSSSFSDVEDEDVSMALDRLSTFGIVDGYDDGTYKPDNKVTRAEFAKLLVTALGLENASSAATGSSEFTDVMGTEWYAGFVNVAAGEGIVGGYPDGSFKPNATVNYGEAVTMLVRALGYKDEFLPGSWPSNYVSKAARLDITDHVTFFPTGESDRGSVAVLLNNTLDSYIIKQDSFGDDNNWVEQDGQDGREEVTLLEDSLEIEKRAHGDIPYYVSAIPEVDSSLDDDEFGIKSNETDDKGNHYSDRLEATNDEILSKAKGLFGDEVVYYLNDDDEVVFVEKSDEDKSEALYVTIDKGSDYFAKDDVDEEIALLDENGDDTSYDLADGATIYVDNEELDNTNKTTTGTDELVDMHDANNSSAKINSETLFGKVVLNSSNEITLMNLHQFENESVVVTDADDEKFSYFNQNDSEVVVEADDFDEVIFFDMDGNELSMDELEENDVLYLNDENEFDNAVVNQSTDDELLYGLVVRNTVEGAGERWKNDEFEIDGEDYSLAYGPTVSVDSNATVKTYGTASSYLEDITDADAEVVALLDTVGDIRHISTDIETGSDEMHGVISDIDWDYNKKGNAEDVDQITVLQQDGDEVDYELDFDKDKFTFDGSSNSIATTAVGAVNLNDTIEFELNNDGEIDTLTLISGVTVNSDNNFTSADIAKVTSGSGEIAKLDDDFEDNQVDTDKGNYVVNSDVVVMDLQDGFASNGGSTASFAGGDVSVVNYENLVDDGKGNDILFKTNDDGEIVFIGLIDKLNVDDYGVGYVLDNWTSSDDDFVEMVLADGTVVEYEVDNGSTATTTSLVSDGSSTASTISADLEDEMSISYVVNSDGTIDIVELTGSITATSSDDDFDVYVGEVDSIDGDRMKVLKSTDGTIETVYDDSDTMYYMEDDEQDFYDIDDGDMVYIVADGKYAKLVQEFDVSKVASPSDDESLDFLRSFNTKTSGGKITGFDKDDSNGNDYFIK